MPTGMVNWNSFDAFDWYLISFSSLTFMIFSCLDKLIEDKYWWEWAQSVTLPHKITLHCCMKLSETHKSFLHHIYLLYVPGMSYSRTINNNEILACMRWVRGGDNRKIVWVEIDDDDPATSTGLRCVKEGRVYLSFHLSQLNESLNV